MRDTLQQLHIVLLVFGLVSKQTAENQHVSKHLDYYVDVCVVIGHGVRVISCLD